MQADPSGCVAYSLSVRPFPYSCLVSRTDVRPFVLSVAQSPMVFEGTHSQPSGSLRRRKVVPNETPAFPLRFVGWVRENKGPRRFRAASYRKH